jgi:hypothetical protein
LPEGANPLDVRYNVINWVHRSTRGWSTGASLIDPRTGEITADTVENYALPNPLDPSRFAGLQEASRKVRPNPICRPQTPRSRV